MWSVPVGIDVELFQHRAVYLHPSTEESLMQQIRAATCIKITGKRHCNAARPALYKKETASVKALAVSGVLSFDAQTALLK